MAIKRIYRIYLLIIIIGLSTACLQRPDSSYYPFGIELRSLAEDVESKTYRDLIKTMTKEDLDEEWKRVATPDNYLVFREEHGGLEKILADKKLKESYEDREKVANKFISLINDAYSAKKRKPPFNQEKLEKLLSGEINRSATAGNFEDITIDTVISSSGALNQWPGFRGPAGQGIAIAKEYPLKWSQTQNVLWKVSLIGRGNSSPAIWNDRIFITSASIDGKIRELICFNRSNGVLLWRKNVPAPEKIEKINPKNSYASATPVTDGERIIAFFGNCGFYCYDMNGELIWKRNVGEFTTMHGPGTNPVLYRDKVLFVQDQGNNKSVFIALNKRSGEIIWSKERDRNAGWSSPVIVHLNSHDELIYNGSFKVKGYNPDTGEQLWTSDGPTREAIPMIVTGSGLIFSASGRNGTILAIRPGGKGDITETHIAWLSKTGGSHVPSPVYHKDRLYVLNDTGILTCLKAGSGEKVWSQRLKGKFTASPVIAADRLIVINEGGLTTILNTGDRFKILYQNEIPEETLASPAILDGHIYIRTALNLYCIGK